MIILKKTAKQWASHLREYPKIWEELEQRLKVVFPNQSNCAEMVRDDGANKTEKRELFQILLSDSI